jgi:SAM-dependent methyltransferase
MFNQYFSSLSKSSASLCFVLRWNQLRSFSSATKNSPISSPIVFASSDSSKQRIIYQKLFREHGDNHKSLHWDSEEGQWRRFDALLQIAGFSVSIPSSLSETPSTPITAEKLSSISPTSHHQYPSDKLQSVLDLGCGLGDLVQHSHFKRGLHHLCFIGVDIVPEFIDAARAKYPSHQAHFVCRDLSTMTSDAIKQMLAHEETELRRQQQSLLIASSSSNSSRNLSPGVDFGICSGMFAFGSRRFFEKTMKRVMPSIREGFAFNIHETTDERFLQLTREVRFCCHRPVLCFLIRMILLSRLFSMF